MRRACKAPSPRSFPLILLFLTFFLSSCLGEELRRQQEQIHTQQEEIARQREEIANLRQAQQQEDQKRGNCNRAFRSFEEAQKSKDKDMGRAIELYRQGLGLCPDDDVAHFELGTLLASMGRRDEAAEAFNAALRINPNFQDAKRRLEALQRSR